MALLSPLHNQVVDATIEVISLEDKELTRKLRNQKMGTFLYVATTWGNLSRVKRLAMEIGYTEEESHFIGYGEKRIQIFCCRCHGLMKVNEVPVNIEVTCIHCHLLLSVSDHYSKERDAFLGYVAKL
ncbi:MULTISPECIES: dimethylamine monooxygenase subunit DmmA family protein [Bacillus]|uniref:dimethylamine monooxygenase subunit DmmA family protein n=1 Tax=Bacillus TaxID=1386 RepID=UPI0011416C7D|nr:MULTISPECIES: dimethylamine monooxygenase subunit DmmA family protein [Bacillus]